MEIKEKDIISYITMVLNKYNKERKLLDTTGCEELIKALIIYNDLSDYIKDISYISEKNPYANMSYSYFNKTINIIPNFMKGIQRSSIELLQMFKITDEIVSVNLDILHAILHEVMHAKQYKYIDTTNDSFLKDVLTKSLSASTYENAQDKDSAMKFINKSKELKIYQLIPSEINAEIEALKQTIEIINHLNIDHKYKYLNMYGLTIKLLELQSYEEKMFSIKSPIEKYIKLRNKYLKDVIVLNKKDIFKYDLDTRLSYGLPIKKMEYYELNNNLKSEIRSNVNQ